MKTWPLLVLALLSACAPDFVDQWEVTKPRLMVAKLSIDGDTEGRTRPRAGESFSIRYFMMSPEKPQQSYDFDLATCIGTILPNGTLSCFGREQVEQLEQLIEEELGIEDVDLGSQLDLPFEVEPYEGNDQLVVRLTLPALPEEIPPELKADRLATFGTFCVDGRVQREPDKDVSDPISEVFQCVDNEDSVYQTALPFTMSILVDVGQPGALNHHPSFECDADEPDSPCNVGAPVADDDDDELVPGAFVLKRPKKVVDQEGGERVLAWPAWDPSEPLPWDDCASAPDSLPKVRAETDYYSVQLRFDASDREEYERTIEENGKPVTELQREELIFSHAITTHGGGLSSYAQALAREAEDDDAVLEFEYTPPRQYDEGDEGHIPESGRLVRFYFSLRDQRGGTDFTTRELCLLPPED